jgi:hypothetical protein
MEDKKNMRVFMNELILMFRSCNLPILHFKIILSGSEIGIS